MTRDLASQLTSAETTKSTDESSFDTDRLEQILTTNKSRGPPAGPDGNHREHGVTEAECQRMNDLDREGYTNRQIGEAVGYSYRTVPHHTNHHCSHNPDVVGDTGGDGQ